MSAWTATPPARRTHDASLGLVAARRAVRVEGSLAGLGSPLVVQLVAGYSIAEGRAFVTTHGAGLANGRAAAEALGLARRLSSHNS
jgi:hypothetical protein